MRLSSLAIVSSAFTSAAVLSLVAAAFSAGAVEDRTEIDVRHTLDTHQMDWAEVQADGLRVNLSGLAPSEAARFNAITVTGQVVDAARVIDLMQVQAAEAIQPPDFSVEILRNEDTLSLIGLIPAATNRDRLTETLGDIDGIGSITDLLETARYPVPGGWIEAVTFAIEALNELPRSKISVAPNHVRIDAAVESTAAKNDLQRRLERALPDGVDLSLTLTAPRPVIAPFTVRFLVDDSGARFDACSADNAEDIAMIEEAARAAGLEGAMRCRIGLGMPSPDWAQAVSTGIAGLTELGGGAITFTDADISLVAAEGTAQGLFDRVVGELENDLPDLYALHATLPVAPSEDEEEGPPEFTATLSPEGMVQLRGRISDELSRNATQSYAQSRFGASAVYTAARLDEDLPDGWTIRVLAALEALSKLSNGVVTVTPDDLVIAGDTGNENAQAEIAQLLATQLGDGASYDISVVYQEKLDPIASLPTPEECLRELRGIQEVAKINFEPGSATISADSMGAMDDIAEVLKACGDIPLEISGHTDSQGREEMNQALSQERATAVLNELRMRRVLTSGYTAVGYGESQPIADNGTEEGREVNRRIEFRLLAPEVPEEITDAALETTGEVAESAAEALATDDEGSGDADFDTTEGAPMHDLTEAVEVEGSGDESGDAISDEALDTTGEVASESGDDAEVNGADADSGLDPEGETGAEEATEEQTEAGATQ
ncbi:OmpA family protein [Maritimibacter alkaliphilus]|uniref:OmpA family protein n=1 Tax=Maritimibacter alkaliphilus TaxID=404236 RepID=UPI001C97D77B|nr:OmpA family protein [Maritimibacter alkaliphilus]MBY6090228.1 OmpA family protein [Maritimibacter alkaliphilus]